MATRATTANEYAYTLDALGEWYRAAIADESLDIRSTFDSRFRPMAGRAVDGQLVVIDEADDWVAEARTDGQPPSGVRWTHQSSANAIRIDGSRAGVRAVLPTGEVIRDCDDPRLPESPELRRLLGLFGERRLRPPGGRKRWSRLTIARVLALDLMLILDPPMGTREAARRIAEWEGDEPTESRVQAILRARRRYQAQAA